MEEPGRSLGAPDENAPGILRGARTLVDVCAKVRSGEDVLIVTDPLMSARIPRAIADIARQRGGDVTLAVQDPRTRDGAEPPAPVAAAMAAARVIFLPVTYSITHTRAVTQALAAGARVLAMTHFTESVMAGEGMAADFEALRPVCERVARKLADGRRLWLSSARGTDLRADITGRRGNALRGVVDPGELTTVPTIEANVSPVEGSASGHLVIDASIPYLDIGLLNEPVHVDVRDGCGVRIAGGPQAEVLARDLEAQRDPHVYNIAEIGIGLNPGCRMIGTMLEDEGVWGTVHIGLGTSITLGGTVVAKCHYDLILWRATIEVDGERVMQDGELRV